MCKIPNKINIILMYSKNSSKWEPVYYLSINLKDEVEFPNVILKNFILPIKITNNFNKNIMDDIDFIIRYNNKKEKFISLEINKILNIEVKNLILCISFKDNFYVALKFMNENSWNNVYNYLIFKLNFLNKNSIKFSKNINLKDIYMNLKEINDKDKLEETIAIWLYNDNFIKLFKELKYYLKIEDYNNTNYIYEIILFFFKTEYCEFLRSILNSRNFKYLIILFNLKKKKLDKDVIKKMINKNFNNILGILDRNTKKNILIFIRINLIYDFYFNTSKRISIYERTINYFSSSIFDYINNNRINLKYISLVEDNDYNLLNQINFEWFDLFNSIYKDKIYKIKKQFYNKELILSILNYFKIYRNLDKTNYKLIFLLNNLSDCFMNNKRIFKELEENNLLKTIVEVFFNTKNLWENFIIINLNLVINLKNNNKIININLINLYFKYFTYIIKNFGWDNLFINLYYEVFDVFNKDFYHKLSNENKGILVFISSNLVIKYKHMNLDKINFFKLLNLVEFLLKTHKNFLFLLNFNIFNILEKFYYKYCKKKNLIYIKIINVIKIILAKTNSLMKDKRFIKILRSYKVWEDLKDNKFYYIQFVR